MMTQTFEDNLEYVYAQLIADYQACYDRWRDSSFLAAKVALWADVLRALSKSESLPVNSPEEFVNWSENMALRYHVEKCISDVCQLL
jgi:hypothetical protein